MTAEEMTHRAAAIRARLVELHRAARTAIWGHTLIRQERADLLDELDALRPHIISAPSGKEK